MKEKELELLVGVSVDVEQIKQRLDVIEQHLTKTPRLRHDLLGRQVVSVGGSATRCVGCPQETDSCLKVELVCGTYLCLDKPHEDTDGEGLGDIMAGIKEKADSFMDYLDKVVINPQEQ